MGYNVINTTETNPERSSTIFNFLTNSITLIGAPFTYAKPVSDCVSHFNFREIHPAFKTKKFCLNI